MRVSICAVGRLKSGPERDLVDDYLTRFDRTGRALGLGPAQVVEVEARKASGRSAEGALLLGKIPDRAHVIAMDERGKVQSSPDFAKGLAGLRDQGVPEVAFVIGGADGLADPVRARAHAKISLGKMVWPHMLARVMLAEQLYRAAMILAGSPYHRE